MLKMGSGIFLHNLPKLTSTNPISDVNYKIDVDPH